MIYIYKILPKLVMPIMIVIQIILIGLFKKNIKMIYLAIVLLYIMSTPIFSNAFFKIIEGSEQRNSIYQIAKADAIVVLSGMLNINKVKDSIYIEWGDPDRFFGGIDLIRADKAPKLIFTGGKMPWSKAKKNEGEILKEYAVSFGVNHKKIFVTKEVQNTKDESLAVKELIGPERNIILVTSAFHMKRAKKLFEEQGINVIPYKVDYNSHSYKSITLIDFFPSANSLAKTEIGFRELLGRLFYILINI